MPQSAIDKEQVEKDPSQGPSVKTSDLAQMADDLFTGMLGMTFDPEPCNVPVDSSSLIQATVRVQGDWNAELRVIASEDLASSIACAMFETDAEALCPEEVHDALGEVANVIGGNAKGVFSGECRLSLPCVGDAFDDVDASSTNQLSVTFQCDAKPLTLVLIEY